ncbi:hypothetical protein [Neokomagataea anthophila]|uniref:Uncharacterized protein n=1 Tax=Neokomagataea anthophila TaxID=2826925 RepID=A0ABS5E3T2_9PROT|nr:hypothetical protein [Neokomagataea anthophila]MBR0558558.1 hypothetical protein [Neokomagataea anthophila]
MYRDDMMQARDIKETDFTEKNKKRLERIARRARDWMNIYTIIFMQRREKASKIDNNDAVM